MFKNQTVECRRSIRGATFFTVLLLTLASVPAARPQEEEPAEESARRPITPRDYGKWESLGFSTALSPDGRWLAYQVRRVDGNNELRLRMLATDSKKVFDHASRPAFSADSGWLAFSIGVGEQERERRQKAGQPVESTLGLHSLVTGKMTRITRVASFRFSDDGKYLVMRRYPVKGREAKGVDIVVRDLASGVDAGFGNVAAHAWNEDGTLLAMVIDAEDKAGNGVQLYDAKSGLLRVLDSADATYKALTWREESSDLAVLREVELGQTEDDEGDGEAERAPEKAVENADGKDAEPRKSGSGEGNADKNQKKEKDTETSHVVITWRNLTDKPRKKTYDHRRATDFPEGLRVVDNAGLRWADDGDCVFFGLKELEKPRPPKEAEKAGEETTQDGKKDAPRKEPRKQRFSARVAPDSPLAERGATFEEEPAETPRRRPGRPGGGPQAQRRRGDQEGPREGAKSLRETLKDPAGVDVWHARDVDIIPLQKKTAEREKQRSYLAAWWMDSDSHVRLGNEVTESVRLFEGQRRALGTDNTPYETERRFGPTLVDAYVIDVRTGARRKVLERVKYLFGSSPDGRYVPYVRGDHFWVYDAESDSHRNLTGSLDTSFINRERNVLTDENFPYGVSGWTKDGRQVVLYDRYDLWLINADGSGARRLTEGQEDRVRHRRVTLDPDEDEFIDPEKPMVLALYGETSKKTGYARLELGERPERLVWKARQVGAIRKAKEAEVYAFTEEDFDDSPDVFVAGPDLDDARQVTATNPFQKDYLWGRSELVDYENQNGQALQGALFYPAGYEPGKRHPMIVYIYEIRSRVVHSYSVPSERNPYSPAVFTSEGYFVFQPDIVYRPQNPGLSAVECVVPAVKSVIATGMIDPERVGLVGHSWGAYQTAFIVTQTDVFAAGVAGAPLTNMMSMSVAIYWNSGQTNAWIFHESQGRMDRPFWRDVDTYIKNSPIFSIDRLDTPLLVAFGDQDGAVDWHQGIEMYNAARLAQKQLVMLVYEGENHGLRKKPNQVDYHYRILEWFGHYLKNDKAPKWITEGTRYLDRQKELEKLRKSAGGSESRPGSSPGGPGRRRRPR